MVRSASPMTLTRTTIAALAFACLAMVFLPTTARAQHSDWLLGTCGLNGATQLPEGFYYQNMWSYYHASGNLFIQTGSLISGPRGSLSLNLSGSGSLDLFVDQNIVAWTTPFKILGANYGCDIDIPFAIADASGAASLEPVLNLPGGTVTPPSLQRSGGTTKGSIGDIYVEPVNLGWHFRYLDVIGSSGFLRLRDHTTLLRRSILASGTGQESLGSEASHTPTWSTRGRFRFTLITCFTDHNWVTSTSLVMWFLSSGVRERPLI